MNFLNNFAHFFVLENIFRGLLVFSIKALENPQNLRGPNFWIFVNSYWNVIKIFLVRVLDIWYIFGRHFWVIGYSTAKILTFQKKNKQNRQNSKNYEKKIVFSFVGFGMLQLISFCPKVVKLFDFIWIINICEILNIWFQTERSWRFEG